VALQRPLFNPGRTPASPAIPATHAAPALPKLAGIVISPDKKISLFLTNSGRLIVATEGGDAGVFKVHLITANGVLVAGPDGIKLLYIQYDRAPPAPEIAASLADVAGSPWASSWTSP
jgi:hypothetical protein